MKTVAKHMKLEHPDILEQQEKEQALLPQTQSQGPTPVATPQPPANPTATIVQQQNQQQISVVREMDNYTYVDKKPVVQQPPQQMNVREIESYTYVEKKPQVLQQAQGTNVLVTLAGQPMQTVVVTTSDQVQHMHLQHHQIHQLQQCKDILEKSIYSKN
jgi:hypothetical protein